MKDDQTLLLVLMNSITGKLNEQVGFDANFNMLLPILLSDCDSTDCKKRQKKLMLVMLSMQEDIFKFCSSETIKNSNFLD